MSLSGERAIAGFKFPSTESLGSSGSSQSYIYIDDKSDLTRLKNKALYYTGVAVKYFVIIAGYPLRVIPRVKKHYETAAASDKKRDSLRKETSSQSLSNVRSLNQKLFNSAYNCVENIKTKKNIEALKTACLTDSSGDSFEKLKKIHKLFDRIVTDEKDRFTDNSSPEKDSLVILMEELSIKLWESPVLDEYKNSSNQTDKSKKLGDLYKNINASITQNPAPNRDSPKDSILWGLSHVEAAWRNYIAGPYQDSTKHGNLVGQIWDLKIGDKNHHVLTGPGTVCPLTQVYQRAKAAKGQPIFIHSLQSTTKSSKEKTRIETQKKLAQDRKIHLLKTDMDTSIWLMKNENLLTQIKQKTPQTPSAYLEIIQPFMKGNRDDQFTENLQGENGVIDEAFNEAAKLLKKLEEKPEFLEAWNELDPLQIGQKAEKRSHKERGQLLQILIQGMSEFAAVATLEEGAFVHSPCKQQIDRGATMAALVKVLENVANEQEIDHAEITGFLRGRAMLTEGRDPLNRRTQPFLNFLRIFNGHEGALCTHLKALATTASQLK